MVFLKHIRGDFVSWYEDEKATTTLINNFNKDSTLELKKHMQCGCSKQLQISLTP